MGYVDLQPFDFGVSNHSEGQQEKWAFFKRRSGQSSIWLKAPFSNALQAQWKIVATSPLETWAGDKGKKKETSEDRSISVYHYICIYIYTYTYCITIWQYMFFNLALQVYISNGPEMAEQADHRRTIHTAGTRKSQAAARQGLCPLWKDEWSQAGVHTRMPYVVGNQIDGWTWRILNLKFSF